VTNMGAPNPHKYTKCIPHRQNQNKTRIIINYNIISFELLTNFFETPDNTE